MFHSLRLQLFLGILVILLAAGGIVMFSSKQEVEQALIDAENRSARNVLNLIELNVSNRYRELLMEKVRIVNERRSSMSQLGSFIASTVGRFEDLVYREVLPRQEARELLLEWAGQLDLARGADVFAVTYDGTVVAHSADDMLGLNLKNVSDIKGRRLIDAIEEEIATYGSSFVLYEEEVMDPQDDGRRFAYFVPISAFDLYLGISEPIEEVERYVELGVEATIEVLADVVSQVQVIDTGFVFIFDTALDDVIPPPAWAQALAAPQDGSEAHRILSEFRDLGNRGETDAISYTLDSGGATREMEAYVSYFRPLGWYIVSTVPSSEIARPAQALIQRQIWIFAAVLAAALLLAWLFAYKLTVPLQRLTGYARQLPEHDFTASEMPGTELQQLGHSNRSEVGGLARAFLYMEGELRDNIRALLETTRAKERIESELNIAQEIQRGLLPKIFPPFPECPHIDLHAALYPARHVGGDLFDFYFLDEHRLCFTVGDVADKGVPSALFMAITKTLVKSASSQDADPARMMQRVNNDLSADNPSAMFVTLLIGVLDIRTGMVEYVNAGQNPPIVVSSATGEARFLKDVSGPAAGAVEDVPYRHLKLQLAPGDMLIVYTDGITEAMSPGKLEYGNERLLRLSGDLKGKSAANIVSSVVEDVRVHSDGATQSDDITILCLSWNEE